LAASAAPDGRVFIATKQGELWQAPVGGGAPTVVLDLTGQVGTSTEQGLLGVAVHPDGSHLYLDATFSDGTARLVEYALTPDGIDEGSARDVITIDDPNPSHNGGRLAFDGDGRLLFGIGDGGNGDVTGASQDLSSLFGKLLRIDPLPSGSQAYGIPADNPFVGEEGARGEVLAYGFRNPWGWALDPATDELYVGDVGQLCREEIDVVAHQGAGENFGWPFVEGAHEFLGPVLGPGGEPADDVDVVDLGARPDVVAPVLEYDHNAAACSVIGGVVYRGTAVPELDGTYLFADLCERSIRTLRRDGDRWVSGRLGGTIPAAIVAFAQAPDGEVYLLSLDDGLYEISAP
jgi:glucose/arabinose dehydrogenase